ncbi:hypothetical protein EAG_11690, partial [Camponotus floridanus]
VRVGRPERTADLRLHNLDEAMTTEEVVASLAQVTGVEAASFRVGPMRRAPNGMYAAWVRCPLGPARMLAKEGAVRIAWSRVRVEVLEPRPTQCYRCLEVGHVRAQCKATVDRSALCYRCGCPGHTAGGCVADPRCPVCADLGRPARHRAGSKACAPVRR